MDPFDDEDVALRQIGTLKLLPNTRPGVKSPEVEHMHHDEPAGANRG